MASFKIAQVAVEGLTYHCDKPYGYRIPEQMEETAVPGTRVFVPFGKGNRRRQGIILETTAEESGTYKELIKIADVPPLINEDMLALAVWVREHTFSTYYEALKLMLPVGLNLSATRKFSLAPGFSEEKARLLPPDESRAVEYIRSSKAPVTRQKLLKELGVPEKSKILNHLMQKEILIESDSFEEKNAQATENMLRLADAAQIDVGKPLTPKQKKVVETISEFGSATLKEAVYYSGVSQSVVRGLVKRGVLEVFEKRVFRNPYKNTGGAEAGPIVLSECQRKAYNDLLGQYRRNEGSASLLFGVTGSGKTLVFMKLIEDVVRDGKSAIVLVPEISLTPQTVSKFYTRFGDSVAVLHSALSEGERLDEWDRIRAGKASIVVGTRSAIFAPVRDLGLIIIDEEQEHTYKSELSPRYHARDIARFRCARSKALLVLSSATPSLETFYAAKRGRYGIEKLEERYGNAVLPEVETVDMKEEIAAGNASPLSRLLLSELKDNIRAGRQSILLLNRRGYNTFISCADCGYVLTCPHCSIPMTYHAANGLFMCHYCGYSRESFSQCPKCHSNHMKYSGAGTQKIESALLEMLPEARILRMDTDTTFSKFSHEKILSQFASGHYDILVGTQMVAKGLNFPKVTLVGVLLADQMLYMNDFRAGERTFSLLTQVVGRSGRGNLRGRAIIQTRTPENPILELAARQDYEAFYESEMKMRKLLLYPPFCDICEIGFSGAEEEEVSHAAGTFMKMIEAFQKEKITDGMPLRITGPIPANTLKVNNRYRYKIVIKCRNNRKFRSFVGALLTQYGKSKMSKKVSAFADLNPLTNY